MNTKAKRKETNRICIVSCHPSVPSGYGVGTKNIIHMLTKLGYDVCVYAIYGILSHTESIEVNGKTVNIYPYNPNSDNMISDLYSVRFIEDYDMVFSFLDLFVFDVQYMEDYWISSLMIDSKPFLPVNDYAYNGVNMVLCTSKWAEDIMLERTDGGDRIIQQFPVPINENDYYIEDKQESRRLFKKKLEIVGNIDKLYTINAANVGDGGVERKNYPELLKWWKTHSENNPGDYLYLHTDIGGLQSKGANIKQLLDLYEVPFTNIRFAQPVLYRFGLLDNDYLRMVYNASDVMIVPSHSEGFGMPYVEAALCGCIPIANDFGTGAEVVRNLGGVTIDCVESYYTKGTIKSKSYAADIAKAVSKALIVKDSADYEFILNCNAREHYSMNTTMEGLQALISRAYEHKQELITKSVING